MNFSTLMEGILAGEKLNFDQSRELMDRIMEGELDEAQIAGLLVGLRARSESPEEIAGFAASMRDHARSLSIGENHRPLVDTCGTGGDAAETFNISTLAAIVAAAGGARVAKHGNRSVSSKCGSADLLEALGVNIALPPEGVEECIRETGIGFMFAPTFHIAMKHAIGPRKSLGIRTVFNLLGPLTNPARADRQLLGVFGAEWVGPVAEALQRLEVDEALVVHGLDGMDEISLTQQTKYAHLKGDKIEFDQLSAEQFGLDRVDHGDISGGTPEENRQLARALLAGEAPQPVEDIVCINAGAVLKLAEVVDTIDEGLNLARDLVLSGDAATTLEDFVAVSKAVASSG